MNAVIGIVLLAIVVSASWYFLTKKKTVPKVDEGEGEPIPVLRERFKNKLLNAGAKRYAMKKYCLKNSMLYNADTNSCEHTETSCKFMGDSIKEKLKTLPDGELKEKVYNYRYEWHPEVDSCVRVMTKIPEMCVRMTQLFVDKNATTDEGLPYRQPQLICDDVGNCDKSLLKLPTCEISEDYCKSKGIDSVKDENGDVTCDVSLGQTVAENLLGSYFVRKFRKNAAGPIVDLVNQAGDVFSHIW